jgi:FKBP-type peptidyl-prolyl cis-trans isomerase
MQKLFVTLACLVLAFGAVAQDKSKKNKKANEVQSQTIALGTPTVKPERPVLRTEKDSASYAYGVEMGTTIKRQLASSMLDRQMVINAMLASINDDSLLISSGNATNIYNAYNRKAQAKIGEEFLAKNKMRKEVTTTASGLQYEVMTKAATPGAKPVATDKVKVHYVGTFIDGKEFDSSVRRGQPASFPLNGVIKGWTEGLQYMNVGDKFKFFIPYQLAYGEQGRPSIPPFSMLIFEVELLEIVK